MLSDEQLIERFRSELRAELADLRPRPDVLDGLWEEARDGAAGHPTDDRDHGLRGARMGWLSFGNLASVTAALVALAVAAAVIVLVHHRAPQPPPIPTTDAVSDAGASITLPVGAPAGPLQVSATSFQGAAISSTVRLVAETPDPRGGLPWGLRAFQTTRGQTCLQVGRVQHGTIGVIGQDGAWANDHRFHPISPNAYTGDSCSQTDGQGHAFNNVAEDGAWRSPARTCHGGRAGKATAAADLTPVANNRHARGTICAILTTGCSARRGQHHVHRARWPTLTEPTNGPNGAYLIVSAPGTRGQTCLLEAGHGRSCSSGGRTAGPELQSGVITQITYRNGSACELPPRAPVVSDEPVAHPSATPHQPGFASPAPRSPVR